MKRIFCTLTVLLIVNFLYAQDLENEGEEEKDEIVVPYNRIGLTILYNNDATSSMGNRAADLINDVKIPDKFDNNDFGSRRLSVSGLDDSESLKNNMATKLFKRFNPGKGKISNEKDSILNRKFNNSNVGMSIVNTLFNYNNGRYNMDNLTERARYNLTDKEVANLQKTAKGVESGAKDLKWSKPLLKNNYVLFVDLNKVQTMSDYYNDKDIEGSQRGYRMELKYYLYKVDFNDSLQAVFWKSAWADESSSDKELKKARKVQNNMTVPLEPVASKPLVVNSSQLKKIRKANPNYLSDEELLQRLPRKAIEESIFQIERTVEAFKVNSTISDYKGGLLANAYAKIGTKEGITPQDRFFAYEYVADNSGNIKKEKRGILWTTNKVSLNENMATGETDSTVFRQIAGKKLGSGMLIQQANAFGIRIGAGAIYNSNLMFGGRVNYTFSPWIYKLIKDSSWSNYPVRNFSLYGEVGFGSHSYEEDSLQKLPVNGEEVSTDVSFLSLSFGLQKDFYVMRNLAISPFVGYRLETATFSEDKLDESISSTLEEYGSSGGIDLGTRLSLNVYQNLRIEASVYFSTQKYPNDESFFGKKFPKDFGGGENDFYISRNPIRFDGMITYQF